MRISIYHKSLWPKYKGAIFSQVYRLSRARALDVSFTHVAETDEIRLKIGGVDLSYHEYPYRVLIPGSYEDSTTVHRISILVRDLLKNRADFVVLPGYDRIENWAMLLVCVLLRRRRAVFCDSTVYDNPQVAWKSFAKRLFFACCHGFVGYGQRTQEYLIKLGAREADIVIPCVAAALPHGYDPAAVIARYEQQRNAAHDAPGYLYVGRLAPEKGLVDLLNAFAAVHSTLPKARLDIVGDGDLRPELAAQARDLGLEAAVTFHGSLNLTDIVPLYSASIALVLPSHREPWGLVVNESLSYGCPVVVSDRCGCVPELVVEGVTGHSFPVGDVDALASAMREVGRLSDDRLLTAKHCVEVASAYSAQRAGTRLLDGCTELLRRLQG